jgi:hypothetical protein
MDGTTGEKDWVCQGCGAPVSAMDLPFYAAKISTQNQDCTIWLTPDVALSLCSME